MALRAIFAWRPPGRWCWRRIHATRSWESAWPSRPLVLASLTVSRQTWPSGPFCLGGLRPLVLRLASCLAIHLPTLLVGCGALSFFFRGSIREGLPVPREPALAASVGRMPERSRHGVSGGQDARSERPATGHGRPRTVRVGLGTTSVRRSRRGSAATARRPSARSERPATGHWRPRTVRVGLGTTSVRRSRRGSAATTRRPSARSERPATGHGRPRTAAETILPGTGAC